MTTYRNIFYEWATSIDYSASIEITILVLSGLVDGGMSIIEAKVKFLRILDNVEPTL